MTGVLFTMAVFLAATGLLAQRIARRRKQAARRAQPGATPEHPLRVRRFDEIDAAIASSRCPCGGRFTISSEGVSRGSARVRVARAVCTSCEEEQDFFFDLSTIEH